MSEAAAARIDLAGVEDAGRLASLAQATFLSTFAGVIDGDDLLAHCRREHGEQSYANTAADPACRTWLATVEPGRAPVGYLVLTPAALPVPDPRADDLEIKRIYLLDRFRGGGLGKRLLERARVHARDVGSRRLLLGVYAGNAAALAFYARLGFVQLGSRRFRVGGNEYDDLVMALELDRG